MPGRIDVHGHLIPGVDDGCKSGAESVRCARVLVGAGYTHAFCTPHVWPSLPDNGVWQITGWTEELQRVLDGAGVGLKVLPGGELNLLSMWPGLQVLEVMEIPTYGMAGKHVLFDFWGESMARCRAKLDPAIDWLLARGLTPVLAHPERIAACINDPASVQEFVRRGVLLQLNTWCLTSPAGSPTYDFAERLLKDGHYFMAGTDLHDPPGMEIRMRGLAMLEKLAGREELTRLTETNPAKLLPAISTATA